MLKYNITNERLTGAIGSQSVSISASSGGGRGSKVHPGGQPGQLGLASWDTQQQQSGGTRGGPLPSGFYTVRKPAQHPHLGLAARLEPSLTALLYLDPAADARVSVTKRGGFYIHGSGPKGSDGCIVIPKDQFAWIMSLLTANAPLMLQVVNPGMRMDKLPNPLRGHIA